MLWDWIINYVYIQTEKICCIEKCVLNKAKTGEFKKCDFVHIFSFYCMQCKRLWMRQYVVNILLPSCHPMSRILLSSVIDQFAMVLETLEIQHHYQLEMIEIKKNSPDVFQVVRVFPVDRDKPWFHGHHGLVYLILTDFSFIIIICLKLKYNAFTKG